MKSPTETVPPPSYQMSVEEFDQKTSRALQLPPSTPYPVDEDGWPIYDPAAFESVAESYEHPPSSSSAGILGSTDSSRHVRQRRPSTSKALYLPRPAKTRSSERNTRPEDGFSSEDRGASPPPAFTAIGPSLDGPPFEEVVGMSYRSNSPAPSLEPFPPSPLSAPLPSRMLQPVEPLRLRSNRHSSPQVQTSSNPYPSHRQMLSRPNHASTIARVEFDPQTAYSPYGGVGNHTSIRTDATAFYNHAVASHLTIGPAQRGHSYTDSRVSSSYSSATPYWAQQATSTASLHEQYAPHVQNFHFGAPAVPPPPPLPLQSYSTSAGVPGVGYARSEPNGTVRGPLPVVPTSQHQWAGSEAQIVQDVYQTVYGGHG